MKKQTRSASAKGASQQAIIDIGEPLPGEALATREDAEFVQVAGLAVTSFLAKAAAFFTRAGEIEKAALARLEDAQKLKPPTNDAEDRAVQNFILQTNADIKTCEKHWDVTTVISGFHRRMTGARKRASDPLDRAKAISNSLHNGWTDAEARRVQRETREAEERASREQERIRQQELDEIEKKIVAAEEKAPELSKREEAFVDAYMSSVTGWRENGRRAADVAGFKKPLEDSARLLSLPKIQKAIKAKREAEALRNQKEAMKAAPLDPVHIDEVKPAAQKVAGLRERTTWSAELLDERALIDAVLEGKLGIPTSILRVDQTELNTFAESLQTSIDRWPGVRAKKKTVSF